MAEATDAARDRVLAARSALAEEIDLLEASARAAVDVPAKIRRSPGKAAAIVGGTGFLVLGGPGRVFRGVKRAVRGPAEPLPKSMLPKEIEKAVKALGKDGDQVRGALERDFAAYAKQAGRDSGSAALGHRAVRRPAAPDRRDQGACRLAVPGRRRGRPVTIRPDPRTCRGAQGEPPRHRRQRPSRRPRERAGLDDESGSAGA